MNKRGIVTIILSVILSLQICGLVTKADSNDSTNTANTSIVTSGNMRGVWVATTANLDYPTKATTDAAALKKEADTILDNIKAMNCNAVFFQVRQASDSLYKSNIFPWSNVLTGSQGTAPSDNFDPLEYWIEGAHKRGMELHAWVNPLRATKSNNASLAGLANTNPAKQHPEYCVKYSDGNYYYNPALPEVRQLIVNGVDEIIRNYDVDGIHFDDYFYPGQKFDDDDSYAKYGNGMNRADWRRENVNKMVQAVHDDIKNYDSSIAFGISPTSVWANKTSNALGSDTKAYESYNAIYADSRKWALENWVDYIAPQVYTEIGNSAADYKTVVDWWSDTLKNSKTKLYIGLADYKCSGVASTSPWYNGKAIKASMDYNRSVSKVEGEIHFRYKFLLANDVNSVIKTAYANSYSAPALDTVTKVQLTTQAPVTTVVTTTEATTEATTKAVTTQTTTQTTTQKVETQTESTTFNINSIVNKSRVKILVYVDGKKVEFDQEPVVINGRTMVPMRAIFEAFGATVSWNNSTQQVVAIKDATELSFIIGEKTMLVNRTNLLKIDVAPVIRNGRTLVPLRVISDALGYNVVWNDPNRVVSITTI